MRKFAVIIENAGRNFSAYSPDLPGCVATGRTIEETMDNMAKAINLHLKGLAADQAQIPKSSVVSTILYSCQPEIQEATV